MYICIYLYICIYSVVGPDFSVHGFDNGAAVRSKMGPGVFQLQNTGFRSVSSLVCAAHLSRLVSQICVSEFGPIPTSSTCRTKTNTKKGWRQRVHLCRSSLSLVQFSKPISKFLSKNSVSFRSGR